MSDIYAQHDAAFSQVSAYVIALRGERVATIAFKLPRDGASRLYAYVHWIGVPMVRGFAGGYGYDKCSAAVRSAVNRIDFSQDSSTHPRDWTNARTFCEALDYDGGEHWNTRLERAGFQVWQAV